MMRSPLTVRLCLFLAATLLAPWGAAAQTDAGPDPAPAPRLLLVLDASGSMWGQIEGENKIVIARRAFRELVAGLPEAAEVGLIAYGHRRVGDCADIETLVPIAALDREAITAVVDGLNPKGKTPITASVRQAFDQLRDLEGPSTVILISDGLETCEGDPCAAVAQAKEEGIDFRLHVVGFGIQESDVSQLECAAQAGEGLYLGADDAAQLTDALGRAVEAAERPEEPPATLAVEAIADGAPADAMVRVLDADGEEVANGRTYVGEETNPRRLPVPPGTYEVVVQALALQGEPVIRFAEVEVPGGEIVERTADFTTGELAVGVTRNGALSDATVKISRPGETASAAGGRTYTSAGSNPAVYRLTPGDYDVEIQYLEIEGAPSHRWEGVTVSPGERTELSREVASGTLKVGVVDGDGLVDAVVKVRRAGETATVAGGRTYTSPSSNPKTFVVLPGDYTVTVQPLRHADTETREIEMTVEAGGTTEEIVRLGG